MCKTDALPLSYIPLHGEATKFILFFFSASQTALESAKLQLEGELAIALNEKTRLKEQSQLLSGSNSDQVDKLTQELNDKDRYNIIHT